MDRRTLTREEALDTVREYKRVISPRYKTEPKVIMYGSYAKGYANPDSDIDVAVILPECEIIDPWEQCVVDVLSCRGKAVNLREDVQECELFFVRV